MTLITFHNGRPQPELSESTLRGLIERITEDLRDIEAFLPIKISTRRRERIREFLTAELNSLKQYERDFQRLNQESQVDYLLIKNYMERELRQLDLDCKQDEKASALIPFATILVDLCEARAFVLPINSQEAAQKLFEVQVGIAEVIEKVENESTAQSIEKPVAFRAARTIDALRDHLNEWYLFYKGYDPSFDWWVSSPYGIVEKGLQNISAIVRDRLVGIKAGDDGAIVGQPIGREGLLADLRAEMIPYSPEELISIGEKEFDWCIGELKKASSCMGLKSDWKQALEKVKNEYVEAGKQTQLVKKLFNEAVEFVEKHDLVTVPSVAKNAWQMFMMSPERQRVNPFFLGGDSIIVSYPTDTMDHEAKLMSMRGNNVHFARATVFHEMIPGHHLQMHVNARSKPYRRIFDSPFSVEGWALYWEFLLWDDERFVKTPENRIGMLFWRLHRCARIIFSIKFHLGQMAPQECIDLLVNAVGHEYATAEGEVRRSLSGEYSPLYQIGYMVGAIQIHAMRKEVVGQGIMSEKIFHDTFLKENRMPNEIMRALMLGKKLYPNYRPSWRFYSDAK
ncbi:hypothetical protein N7533_001187 [Penicillium manginii]|jgi:uncharacterized protein (DUF885 family)|uniref:uncharacterized protein n=1 Tax=Penicillium manginii TaxID=203109 RepID=UPI002546A2F4|nr:uncharacterized protein N7533_001187 [Penicillium manginii]KAJ5768604.1 hypothetical protein N7533_001187 [Penicillium manginii]